VERLLLDRSLTEATEVLPLALGDTLTEGASTVNRNGRSAYRVALFVTAFRRAAARLLAVPGGEGFA
jgi:hypothetical protein